MTPERIAVTGFLCYRDTQEACFAGGSLWMLAGPNGSGKSSLFDAVTFALYGLHRGGRQNAAALINRHCDRAIVEFDFRLGDDLYRVRRTICHGTTRADVVPQILRHLPEDAGDRWEEIAGTDTRGGCDDWVREHIGLTAETFTASVMLRQGQADRLLNELPSERHRFLCEIVGLEQFERLHERANANRQIERARAEVLADQLSRCPAISDEEISTADQSEASAAQDVETTAVAVETLRTIHRQSQQWAEWTANRDQLRNQEAALAALLENCERIERQAARLELLDRHLDRLEELVRLEGERTDAERERTRVENELQPLSERGERLRADADRVAAALAGRQTDVERLAELSVQVERERSEVAAALPWLEAIHRERDAARAAEIQANQATTELTQLREQREQSAANGPSEDELQTAEALLRQATDGLAAAAARSREAEERCRRFHEVSEGRSCRYCGQDLPPNHVETEAARLHDERDKAARACEEAQTARDSADAHHRDVQSRFRALDQALREIEGRVQSAGHAAETARRAHVESGRRACEAATHLPERFREIIEPSGGQPGGNGSVQAKLDLLRHQRQGMDEQLHNLGGELAAITADVARLTDERADHEVARQELLEQIQTLERRLLQLDARSLGLSDSIAAARRALPVEWLVASGQDLEALREFADELRRERHSLREMNVAGRLAELRDAKVRRETLCTRLDVIDERIGSIPEDARRDPHQVAEELAAAESAHAQAARDHRQAADRSAELRRRREQHSELDERYCAADRSRHLWERLTSLLGREYLQRDLVRRAERQIVEYAAATLDRLSGGTLHIELRPDADDCRPRAFDLLAHQLVPADPTITTDDATNFHATGGSAGVVGACSAVEVAFLSGSQRFRVAVALSLAIGQYAGNSRRPIRSVIIDEGFGCLDAENRQVMIQELHGLQAHLDRIILVSHQDEFTDAFPDGYRCEPTPEGTRLVPFHR
jgi:DNA repair exonuclease SbcCD ATPase subunit